MNSDTAVEKGNDESTETGPRGRLGTIPVVALGMSMSLFFVISYLLCILLYLIWPGMAADHAMLVFFLPWFELLNWPSFFIGLVETFGYGWYVALIFAPLYNFFVTR